MSGILADAPEHDRPKVARPAVGTRLYLPQTQQYAEVTEHTARGFKYRCEPSSFIPRWGLSSTGEGEMVTDIPEWDYVVRTRMIDLLP